MKKDVLLTQTSNQEIASTNMGLSPKDEIGKDFSCQLHQLSKDQVYTKYPKADLTTSQNKEKIKNKNRCSVLWETSY